MARKPNGEAEIQPDGKVQTTAPEGQTEKTGTLGDLLNSEFFGMWKDRTDIKDSVEFARELREKAWRRSK